MKKNKTKKTKLPEPEFYGNATVGTKGQIVIPIDAREKYDIKTGDRLIIFGSNAGVLAIIKAEQMNEILNKMTPEITPE